MPNIEGIEFGIPAMFHTGDTYSERGKLRFSRPLNLDEVAVDNPELKIVMSIWVTLGFKTPRK